MRGAPPLRVKSLFEGLVAAGLVWLLLFWTVGAAAANIPSRSHQTSQVNWMKERETVDGREKVAILPQSKSTDLNYMSKRRVPNGPDPIHNRRAGNSQKPPRQA